MPTIVPFPRRTGSASRHGVDPVQVAYDTLAPAYDAFTAGYHHDRWLTRDRTRRAPPWPSRPHACSTSPAAPARASSPCSSAATRSPAATSRRRWPAVRRRKARPRGCSSPTCASSRCSAASTSSPASTTPSTTSFTRTRSATCSPASPGTSRPGGLAIWDINTLSMLRSSFSSDWVADRGEWFLAWHGTASRGRRAGRHRRGAGRRVPAARHRRGRARPAATASATGRWAR